MKTFINNLFTRLGVAPTQSRACLGGASRAAWVLPALIAGLGLIPAGHVIAQIFTTLHSFPGYSGQTTNSDGAAPMGMILSGNTLYGTAFGGGSSGRGTVFALSTDGSGFTILHSFTALSGPAPSPNNDGANPQAALTLSGNTLYGTAASGGSSGYGTVFAVNTDGTGFRTLHNFAGYPSESGGPWGGLILSGNTLYGTTVGTSPDSGTVFVVNTDGSGFSALHSFTRPTYPSPINSDGVGPKAGLVLSGNTLYGTTASGGGSGSGTVFAVNTDGTGFTTLHSFTAVPSSGPRINSDGANTQAGLVLSGNALYGTAWQGGSSARGTVFAVNTDGSGFTILHSFTAPSGPAPSTNNDGAGPYAGLVLSGNTLYGTTASGGGSGSGTVFAVNTNGTGFTTLHSFSAVPLSPAPLINSDGAWPQAGLILSGNTLYGTTVVGGSSGKGTVFSLSLPSVSAPQLTLASDGSGGYFIRAQGDPNFTCRLQRAPDLSGPWDTIDTNTAPDSGLIEFHDTIPLPGQAFYRTVQP